MHRTGKLNGLAEQDWDTLLKWFKSEGVDLGDIDLTKELKEDAANGDADATTILNDIDNGKVEFRMLKDGSVMLHPIDI